MAEAFINQVNRAVGIVTSSSNASIGVGLTWMSGISTAHVAINDLVDNSNFIAGTKVTLVGVSSVESQLASKIPVPTGSSFVISDAGKTVLEGDDELRVYCDTENAIDVNLSILKGVS